MVVTSYYLAPMMTRRLTRLSGAGGWLRVFLCFAIVASCPRQRVNVITSLCNAEVMSALIIRMCELLQKFIKNMFYNMFLRG